MRRVATAALPLLLLALGACGDNEPACGHVKVLVGGRNVWSPIFAVDEQHMYYADYDVDGYGTKLLLRASRDGGGLQSLGQVADYEMFGNGIALDDRNVYWTASRFLDNLGYSLYASPRAGGSPFPIANLPPCVPFGVTSSTTEVFAGTSACDAQPSRVTAVDKTTSNARIAWEAGMNDGDVRALAYGGDTLFIATEIALFAVRPSATEVVTAGNTIRHLEVHDDFLYYAEEHDGVYRTPLAGGTRELLYAYAPTGERQGAFSLDGDDLYVADPPHMMFVPLATRTPQAIVHDVGSLSEISARDGYAWWSSLVLPAAPGGLDTFSGGIERVARPCD
ncbi:MAG TPA: hypothetical protein VMZ53_06490 [Kofleriaceae bacterium]|nr:hypothetical protein [Kofleriaceae bacterium]